MKLRWDKGFIVMLGFFWGKFKEYFGSLYGVSLGEFF